MEMPFKREFVCDQKQAADIARGDTYCQQCQKHVLDAQNWSTEEISFRLKHAGGSMCLSLSDSQLQDGKLELAIVHAVPRRLRFWELFLLSLVFAFGLANGASAQLMSPQDSKAIDQIYDTYAQACVYVGDRTQGTIGLPPGIMDWDSLGAIDRLQYGGREIIVLSEPIFFFPRGTEICLTTVNNKVIPEMVRPWQTIFRSMEVIMDFPWKVIMIYGHADPSEPDPQALSLARANFVANQLRYWGIPNKIIVKAIGTGQPYEDTPYKNYDGKERRVRIVLLEPGQE